MRLNPSIHSTTQLLKTALIALLALSYLLRYPLLLCAAAVLLLHRIATRRRPALLLDFACHLPPPDRKCTFELSEYFVRRSGRFSTVSEEFMRSIFLKSGLGLETYAPPFVFDAPTSDSEANLDYALLEAREGIFGCIDSLLSKTRVDPAQIDHVIVTCGSFSPSPSLSSLIINRYKLRPEVKTYNLSGMGCSSGVVAIDLAARMMDSGARRSPPKYGLVVITENISLNWYFGDNRSMLVTNCIFRVGCAAAIVTNDHSRRREAKAAFQEEDEKGTTGVSLTKDLIHVAGNNLKKHITALAPRVLPLSQLAIYAKSLLLCKLFPKSGLKPAVPDFSTAFEHMCIHTGGKAVIDAVSNVLRLPGPATEPARMTLHRFGNTSSSLVFYELAYFEAKRRIKKGDRVWMLAFGTGFKAGSLVWRAVRDSEFENDNPWNDCVHRYPLD
ncbi:hypothetical protein V2J09_001448 [Rumex salicifolius]